MRQFRWLVCLLCLALLPPAASSGGRQGEGAPRRIALVIGNNAYPQSPLANPINDAKAMVVELRQVHFDVRPLYDANLKTMQAEIERFCHDLGTGDVGLFYFAGHGIQLEGENYLIPIDFRAQSEDLAATQSYSATELRVRMESSKANLNIIILDACRNNPFLPTRSTSKSLASMKPAEGTFIALSTSPGSQAKDGYGSKNSPFTGSLIEALREPELTLGELFDQVKLKVRAATKNYQVPWTASSTVGEFYFRPPPGWKLASRRSEVAAKAAATAGQSALRPVVTVSPEMAKLAAEASQQGVQLMQAGRHAEAIAYCEQAVRLNPNSGEAFLQLGLALWAAGQRRAALSPLNEAVGLLPNSAQAYWARGMALIEVSDYERAVEDFTRVIQLDPDFASAKKVYWHRGNAYSKLGNQSAAAADRKLQTESTARKSDERRSH